MISEKKIIYMKIIDNECILKAKQTRVSTVGDSNSYVFEILIIK